MTMKRNRSFTPQYEMVGQWVSRVIGIAFIVLAVITVVSSGLVLVNAMNALEGNTPRGHRIHLRDDAGDCVAIYGYSESWPTRATIVHVDDSKCGK